MAGPLDYFERDNPDLFRAVDDLAKALDALTARAKSVKAHVFRARLASGQRIHSTKQLGALITASRMTMSREIRSLLMCLDGLTENQNLAVDMAALAAPKPEPQRSIVDEDEDEE